MLSNSGAGLSGLSLREVEEPQARYRQVVRELTGSRGVDLVVEVGGSLEQSLRADKLEGQVAFVGQLQQRQSMIDIDVIYKAVATVRVIFAGNRAQFMAMNRTSTANKLHPVIDRVFDFGDAPAAFRYYDEVRPFGKVVIRH